MAAGFALLDLYTQIFCTSIAFLNVMSLISLISYLIYVNFISLKPFSYLLACLCAAVMCELPTVNQ